jgi:hypothetical protein
MGILRHLACMGSIKLKRKIVVENIKDINKLIELVADGRNI